MSIFYAGLPGKIKTILDRLTVARANGLDNITAGPVALAATALSTAVWQTTKAPFLDMAVSGAAGQSKSSLYTASSGSFTPAAGVTLVYVTLQGAGASGSRHSTDPGGGGAGELIWRLSVQVTPGVSISYSAPAGPTGPSSAGLGTTGGDATFGPLLAKGGKASITLARGGAGGGVWGAAEPGFPAAGVAGTIVGMYAIGGASGGSDELGGPCIPNRVAGSIDISASSGGSSFYSNGGAGGGDTNGGTPAKPGWGAGGGGVTTAYTRNAGSGGDAMILVEWNG